MEEIYNRYRHQVAFFVIYIQEAHPTDGWQVDSNIVDGVFYPQHRSYAERETVAQACGVNLNITLPILIEEMDNTVDQAYGAAPERLYLVGTDGRVVYKGGAGPFFFDLDEWEHAIETCLRSAEVG